MIVMRNVFQAKYGRGDELVELLQEGRPTLAKHGMGSFRILTDLTGAFFTVEMEMEMDSLADFERTREAFADPDFEGWFGRMTELVDNGSRQFFTVVE